MKRDRDTEFDEQSRDDLDSYLEAESHLPIASLRGKGDSSRAPKFRGGHAWKITLALIAVGMGLGLLLVGE